MTEADGALAHAAGVAASLVNRNVPASLASSGAQPANAPVDDDWAAYGRSQPGLRYSPLRQINRDNVAQLKQAWLFHTGDLPSKRWGAETTPLKVGDSLYVCTARNQVIALDASSGKQRWRYDPKVKDEAIPYTAACRGVSYYEMPAAANDGAGAVASDASAMCRTRIIEGTLDGRLIALDARSGTPCADFGNNGQVDITVGMGETPSGYVSINSPPAIVRGVVVTGHQVLDGQKRYEPSGVIEGFDAVTGKLRWAWDMTHPDWNGAPPAGQSWTRGTPNMWTTAAADEQLGYVYLPMGNSTADYWSSSRTPQENRNATSLVALDVTTGKPVWNFQTTHIDAWDYDLGSQPRPTNWAGHRATKCVAMRAVRKVPATRRLARPTRSTSMPAGACRSPSCCARSLLMAASARSIWPAARRYGTVRSAVRAAMGRSVSARGCRSRSARRTTAVR
ncbi:Glycerol dehydrogenase large subunit [Xanthomonas hortorum pv. cynarae]|nr:Glycerol dehydrogenase large subunit [Xanthomonas hortorum pv. cynarae]CAD0319188.1 Glycerol dehydrogenase large subunit [Xanthomonas hortorum pv. cynarae]